MPDSRTGISRTPWYPNASAPRIIRSYSGATIGSFTTRSSGLSLMTEYQNAVLAAKAPELLIALRSALRVINATVLPSSEAEVLAKLANEHYRDTMIVLSEASAYEIQSLYVRRARLFGLVTSDTGPDDRDTASQVVETKKPETPLIIRPSQRRRPLRDRVILLGEL